MTTALKTGLVAAAVWAAILMPGSFAFGAEMPTSEAAKLLDKSVVEMTIDGKPHCTAAKIGPAEFLTAGHCVRGLKSDYRLLAQANTETVISVTTGVARKDQNRTEDWALLHTATPNDSWDALALGCDEEPYLGMPIAYMGYPSGVQRMFAVGYISSLTPRENNRKPIGNSDYIVDLTGAPGASGSPIISLETGHIIGILTEGVIDRNVGVFAVGIESIKWLDRCSRSNDG